MSTIIGITPQCPCCGEYERTSGGWPCPCPSATVSRERGRLSIHIHVDGECPLAVCSRCDEPLAAAGLEPHWDAEGRPFCGGCE